MTVVDGVRKAEILDAAADIFATAGIRASLSDIADVCGIHAGSLYHHFESKEAIVIDLIRRYETDLEQLAVHVDEAPIDADPVCAIRDFATAIAKCAVRNRAAVLLSFYDPPTSSTPELTMLVNRSPVAIKPAMHALLRRGQETGALRDALDLGVLADRLCQSMLHIAIGVTHRDRGTRRLAELKCRMLLEGLSAQRPIDSTLDRSPARRAADDIIREWSARGAVEGGREAVITAAARVEFGRRGYDATTIRDIAATAGVNPGALYRIVASKEELLGLILRSYVTSVTDGWNAILRSPSTPLEKLDALLWLNINVLDRFSEEHRIQSALLQVIPPDSPNLSLSFPSLLRQLRRLLADAEFAGGLLPLRSSADLRARCAFSLVWTPEDIIADLGASGALQFARETLLWGAAVRTP